MSSASAADYQRPEPATFASERAEGDFTDAELTVLALAADPDQDLDPNAVPLSEYSDDAGDRYSPLPGWYMPAPMVRGQSRLRTAIVLSIVVSLLLIEALGLCVTYGQLVAA
jgi:hypothetical protein